MSGRGRGFVLLALRDKEILEVAVAEPETGERRLRFRVAEALRRVDQYVAMEMPGLFAPLKAPRKLGYAYLTF